MSKLKNNRTKGIPHWQLNKMKMIHAERWLEIWKVVENRDVHNRNSQLSEVHLVTIRE